MSTDWSEWSTKSLLSQLDKQINSDKNTIGDGNAGSIPGEMSDIEKMLSSLEDQVDEEAREIGEVARDLSSNDWDEEDLRELGDAENKLKQTIRGVERVKEEVEALENAMTRTIEVMEEIGRRAS